MNQGEELIDKLFGIGEQDSIDTQALKDKLKACVSNILKSSHNDPRKHDCSYTKKSLNFACPICGDSKRNPNMRRGHIYLANNFYKCYNEDSCSRPLDAFLEHFRMDDEFSMQEMDHFKFISGVDSGVRSKAGIIYSHANFKQYEHLFFSRDVIFKIFGLQEVDRSPAALQVLQQRKIPEQWWPQMAYDPTNHEMVIFNSASNGGKILGFQRRLLRKNRRGLRYLSRSYQEIVIEFLKVEDPNMKLIRFLDQLGSFFNIMNLDWNSPIPVFEGAIDAMMLNNSTATLSASNDIRHPNFHYIYDDDDTGKTKAMEKLDMGFQVFLWNKFKEDHYDYKMTREGRPVKDFNELYKLRKFHFSELLPYFSNNPLHKLYL